MSKKIIPKLTAKIEKAKTGYRITILADNNPIDIILVEKLERIRR